MHRFDYSFLDNGMLPARLLNITADIYTLRVMALDRKEQFEDIFTELAAIAKVQSVKSSNAIEGIVTTDKRINEIVNGNSAPLNIIGRDLLKVILKVYEQQQYMYTNRTHSVEDRMPC